MDSPDVLVPTWLSVWGRGITPVPYVHEWSPITSSAPPGNQAWAPGLGLASSCLAQAPISLATGSHTAPQSTPTPSLSSGPRHRLYPAPGTRCQLGQSSVPPGADGSGRDPLGSPRTGQVTGDRASLCVGYGAGLSHVEAQPLQLACAPCFLGGAPQQRLPCALNKEELVGLPIDSQWKRGL